MDGTHPAITQCLFLFLDFSFLSQDRLQSRPSLKASRPFENTHATLSIMYYYSIMRNQVLLVSDFDESSHKLNNTKN